MQSLRKGSWGTHPVRRGDRAFQAQPCHQRGTQHQHIQGCMRGHRPCLTASDTLARPPVTAAAPPQGPPHSSTLWRRDQGQGVGVTEEISSGFFASSLLSGWGGFVVARARCQPWVTTWHFRYVQRPPGNPATFPDVVPVTTSTWAATGTHLGNAATKFREGKKANLPNTVSMAVMNISSFKMGTNIFESWRQWRYSPVWQTASGISTVSPAHAITALLLEVKPNKKHQDSGAKLCQSIFTAVFCWVELAGNWKNGDLQPGLHWQPLSRTLHWNKFTAHKGWNKLGKMISSLPIYPKKSYIATHFSVWGLAWLGVLNFYS